MDVDKLSLLAGSTSNAQSPTLEYVPVHRQAHTQLCISQSVSLVHDENL